MLEIIENFCQNNKLLFGITDEKCLITKHKNIAVPFANYEYEERVNPLLQMESCKSIIVFLMPYKINTFSVKTKPRIASPNQCYDYHNIFNDKLNLLVNELYKVDKFEYKIFVDNGKLIERELAKKAGLGYFSKNANLMNEKLGSSFFIGYIMMDKKIDFDTKIVEKNCGDCTICAKKCPSKAINGDYTINHSKCLSYTTQKKEDITKEEKLLMGNNIYGCNICVTVCPKNKDNLYYEEENFEFEDFLYNTRKEFEQKFKDKGFKWRGNSVLKRNAQIAKENSEVNNG